MKFKNIGKEARIYQHIGYGETAEGERFDFGVCLKTGSISVAFSDVTYLLEAREMIGAAVDLRRMEKKSKP